jgi:cytosine/adenosine deaminase-related metal-dependent hydrolase
MRKITADAIYTVSGERLVGTILVLDNQGTIVAIEPLAAHDLASVERYEGVIVPGFVNAHCHLELSHMKGRINTGTQLIPFITSVVQNRAASPELIETAMRAAEQEMLEGGIVAVGDISNQTDTFALKAASKLRFFTFVEFFDLLQTHDADKVFNQYNQVYQQAPKTGKDAASCVPHAPYSVSDKLFGLLNTVQSGLTTISIHNQETQPETELFMTKSGDFVRFYEGFGMKLDDFEAIGQTSIHYALARMNPQHRSLFVHNTLTSAEDLATAMRWSEHTFWATCPNANLYIENRLPNYKIFMDAGAKVCVGTDSLTSNWKLSILDELKTIAKYQSYVPFETMLRWATLNGAEALGMEAQLGSIEVGKQPGLNLITGLDARGLPGEHTQVRVL